MPSLQDSKVHVVSKSTATTEVIAVLGSSSEEEEGSGVAFKQQQQQQQRRQSVARSAKSRSPTDASAAAAVASSTAAGARRSSRERASRSSSLESSSDSIIAAGPPPPMPAPRAPLADRVNAKSSSAPSNDGKANGGRKKSTSNSMIGSSKPVAGRRKAIAVEEKSAHMIDLEEHVADVQDTWENESWIEDVIGSNTEDRFFSEIPGACSPAEAMAYRRLLREVGPVEFMKRTIDAGLVTAEKLLTAFSVRPPQFLKGMPDDEYLPFLTTALIRELKKRAKLWRYNTVDDAVSLIKQARNIVVLTGAGISTSLGIPDFRSKDIGLYSKLAHLGLNDPQEVFDIHTFRDDPTIFYSVARDILPEGNRFSPTHGFIAMLQNRGKLLTNYTQNIDNLEAAAGIRPEKLVQCHGSFSTASCIDCKHQVEGSSIFPTIRAGRIPRCPECGPKSRITANSRKRKVAGDGTRSNTPNATASSSGAATPAADASSTTTSGRPQRAVAARLNGRDRASIGFDRGDSASDSEYFELEWGIKGGIMKPDITFFGEQLPAEFGNRLMTKDVYQADLVVVIGTSLKVAPVSEVVPLMPASVPQIHIGRFPIAHHNFDIEMLGDCDVVVAELCNRLCWDLNHEMVDPKQKINVSLEEGYYSRHNFVAIKNGEGSSKKTVDFAAGVKDGGEGSSREVAFRTASSA